MSGPELITLGCRLNIAESETMRMLAGDVDDLIIVNSCAVTAEAVKQTRKAIRQAKRARPDARIMVTGCAAEIDPAMFEGMAEVERVVPNRAKLAPGAFEFPTSPVTPDLIRGPAPSVGGGRMGKWTPDQVRGDESGMARDSETPAFAGVTSGSATHARAFVEVQNGCDHSCTFCIIPQGRGPNRSVPAGALVQGIRGLVAGGAQEVVLTGVDITSYGADLPGQPTLGMLVERILRLVPELPRLRLSSLDSVEIDDRLFDLIAGEARIMPHLHLSLQAGDDMILKRMKRRHSRAQAVAIVQRLKAARPGIAIGADLIAGFPTETEAMAENTLQLIEDCDIVFGHIFPYSPRTNTPAARMPQVPPEVARARAKRLREAAARRQAAWLEAMTGSVQNVLVELDGESGHSENFARVRLHTPGNAPANRILPVRITGLSGTTLIGEPA